MEVNITRAMLGIVDALFIYCKIRVLVRIPSCAAAAADNALFLDKERESESI